MAFRPGRQAGRIGVFQVSIDLINGDAERDHHQNKQAEKQAVNPLCHAQRLRIRLMTILSTRFNAACSALVAGPRGLGLFFVLGTKGLGVSLPPPVFFESAIAGMFFCKNAGKFYHYRWVCQLCGARPWLLRPQAAQSSDRQTRSLRRQMPRYKPRPLYLTF